MTCGIFQGSVFHLYDTQIYYSFHSRDSLSAQALINDDLNRLCRDIDRHGLILNADKS